MSSESVKCSGLTKQGDRCRNYAVAGSHYCARHGGATAETPTAAVASAANAPVAKVAAPKSSKPSAPPIAAAEMDEAARIQREKVKAVAEDLNKIAEEVAKKDPKYTPPPFSPEALRNVLKSNVDTLKQYMPLSLVNDILRNLEGTKPTDLLDPEVWSGLWYILNYTAQSQTKAALESIGRRLDFVPGMDLMTQFSVSVVESPGDLLDIETWKGAATILNAAVMANASALKRKVLGGSES